jgi:hypothetical protein
MASPGRALGALWPRASGRRVRRVGWWKPGKLESCESGLLGAAARLMPAIITPCCATAEAISGGSLRRGVVLRVAAATGPKNDTQPACQISLDGAEDWQSGHLSEVPKLQKLEFGLRSN